MIHSAFSEAKAMLWLHKRHCESFGMHRQVKFTFADYLLCSFLHHNNPTTLYHDMSTYQNKDIYKEEKLLHFHVDFCQKYRPVL